MLLANDYYGNKIRTKPKKYGTCPFCNELLVSKCGDIRIWHWAHRGENNCVFKPKTEWHMKWQLEAYNLGHIIEHRINNHIVDIITKDNRIIELQHSPINKEDLLSRCCNAKKENLKIDWIFDFSKEQNNKKISIDNRSCLILDEEIVDLTYKVYLKKSTAFMQPLFNDNNKPKFGNIWFDLGYEDTLFYVKGVNNSYFWGYLVKTKDFFTENFLDNLQDIIKLEKNEYIWSKYGQLSFDLSNMGYYKLQFVSNNNSKNNKSNCEYITIEKNNIGILNIKNKDLCKQLAKLDLKGNTFYIITGIENYSSEYSRCKVVNCNSENAEKQLEYLCDHFYGHDIHFNEDNNFMVKVKFISGVYEINTNSYGNTCYDYEVMQYTNEGNIIGTLSITSKKFLRKLNKIELKGNIFHIFRRGEGFDTTYYIRSRNLKYKNKNKHCVIKTDINKVFSSKMKRRQK